MPPHSSHPCAAQVRQRQDQEIAERCVALGLSDRQHALVRDLLGLNCGKGPHGCWTMQGIRVWSRCQWFKPVLAQEIEELFQRLLGPTLAEALTAPDALLRKWSGDGLPLLSSFVALRQLGMHVKSTYRQRVEDLALHGPDMLSFFVTTLVGYLLDHGFPIAPLTPWTATLAAR